MRYINQEIDMDLNKLKEQAYKTACEHGFHDVDYSDEHWIMLVITELSEAVEADRKGKRADKSAFQYREEDKEEFHFETDFKELIKDSVEDELADACIRLLDFAKLRSIYICGPVLNMKDINLINLCFRVTVTLTRNHYFCYMIDYALGAIISWCALNDIDISWHIEQKMKYNSTRDALHGKKY